MFDLRCKGCGEEVEIPAFHRCHGLGAPVMHSLPPTDSPGSPAPKVDRREMEKALANDVAFKLIYSDLACCPHYPKQFHKSDCRECVAAALLTFADRVRGEREKRLREALREIADTFEIDWHEAQEIARRALAEGGDGE